MPDPIHIGYDGHGAPLFHHQIARTPDKDPTRVLTDEDAAIHGYDLPTLRAKAAWTPEPKLLPPELAPEYHAEPYRAPEPRHWANVGDQLDVTLRERLIEYARGVL